jgi:hypothetical protein
MLMMRAIENQCTSPAGTNIPPTGLKTRGATSSQGQQTTRRQAKQSTQAEHKPGGRGHKPHKPNTGQAASKAKHTSRTRAKRPRNTHPKQNHKHCTTDRRRQKFNNLPFKHKTPETYKHDLGMEATWAGTRTITDLSLSMSEAKPVYPHTSSQHTSTAASTASRTHTQVARDEYGNLCAWPQKHRIFRCHTPPKGGKYRAGQSKMHIRL